jgi:hypothetical protein
MQTAGQRRQSGSLTYLASNVGSPAASSLKRSRRLQKFSLPKQQQGQRG